MANKIKIKNKINKCLEFLCNFQQFKQPFLSWREPLVRFPNTLSRCALYFVWNYLGDF